MPPTTKERIWQALRIGRHLTVTELAIIVEASPYMIRKYLRQWIGRGLARSTTAPRKGYGGLSLIYSLTDPQIVNPPK